MKLRSGLLCGFLVAALGCGGGGGISGPPSGSFLKFTVQWGERSRSLDGLGSAQSVLLQISGAGVPNGDFTFAADRDAGTAAHATTYTATTEARPGPHLVTATFYAQPSEQGAVVGIATGTMTVDGDGTLSGTITTVGTIESVQIPAGQAVGVGQTRLLACSALNHVGDLVVVTPGSILWKVVSGSDKLTFESGSAKGLAVGAASVVATIDGIPSQAASVNVTSGGVVDVTINPPTAVVAPNGTKQFTSSVSGSDNHEVTWTVLTQGGGSIGATGLYSAGSTVMYATVEARSVADPTKAATAIVTIQRSTLTVTVTPNPATVAGKAQRQFTATVDGSPNQTVTWTVTGAGVGGTISSEGVYTAPDADGTSHVTATSLADPRASGTATVRVLGSKGPRIAYRDAMGQLFTVNSDGTEPKQISTDIQCSSTGIAWSPDGSRLAFKVVSGLWTPGIWLMDADGSNATPLAVGTLNKDHHPTWSPDGQMIAYNTEGSSIQNRIYMKPVGGGTPSFISIGTYLDTGPDWSPDGTKFAYTTFVSGTGGISVWTVNADGSGETQITHAVNGPESDPVWSPDGSKIMFWSESDTAGIQIYVVNADGSGLVRLTTDGINRYADWSPDGTKIVFSHRPSFQFTSELWVMNSDGSGKTQILTGSYGAEFWPAWRRQ